MRKKIQRPRLTFNEYQDFIDKAVIEIQRRQMSVLSFCEKYNICRNVFYEFHPNSGMAQLFRISEILGIEFEPGGKKDGT